MSDTISQTELDQWWTRFHALCLACDIEAVSYSNNNFDVHIKIAGYDFELPLAARVWLEGLMITARDRKRALAVERETYRECEECHDGDEHCGRQAHWEVTRGDSSPGYCCERHLNDACSTTLKPVTVSKWPHG